MSNPYEELRIGQGHVYPADAAKLLMYFFEDFSLEDVQSYLSKLLVCALTESSDQFTTCTDRSNILFFCERLWHAIQACRLLQQKSKCSNPPSSSLH
ncbi:hypothetical protein [Paraflavitalea speifideaquila]|uniref:hypothetical protein n=1 Tax=Paraflavitalea speifideaquila TaxID=3076558 RepID=UPI0028EB9BDB|nr:hypothetical protein [Paraflavitalea speifideiaquila]